MPLGLLAKDSILDLQGLAAESEAAADDLSEHYHDGATQEGQVLVAAVPGPDEQAVVVGGDGSGGGGSSSGGSVGDASSQEGSVAGSGGGSDGAIGANPQQAQEDDTYGSSVNTSPSSTYGNYAGFDANYHYPAYDNYLHSQQQTNSHSSFYGHYDSFDQYSKSYPHAANQANRSSLFLGERSGRPKSLFDCIFPCWPKALLPPQPQPLKLPDRGQVEPLPEEAAPTSLPTRSSSRDEDEVSTNSDVLGERLSDKERQAVLARLRLAQPDGNTNDQARVDTEGEQHEPLQEGRRRQDQEDSKAPARSTISKKGLLNGIPVYDTSPLDTGAASSSPPPPTPLKGILKKRSMVGLNGGGKAGGGSNTAVTRRSLFPSYETTSRPKSDKNVSFAPMARVVTVKSKNDMTAGEKADVWFQKSDYDDFRKTGRIITKAMLEGGSEIWLTESTRSSKSRDSSSSVGASTKASSSSSSSASVKKNDKDHPADTYSAAGDKWWHKFGHSRRGLEHVVSFEEGRQRQMNVRNAIHAVLEEQTRQKRYRREDEDKLRSVSLSHTTWARDLALAAGSSDADAVQSSFAEDRKSREFYLLKMARSSPIKATNTRVPEFMQPTLAAAASAGASGRPVMAPSVVAHKLDAHTAAQIRYRRDQQKSNAKKTGDETSSASPATSERGSEESSEPIRDPHPSEENGESLAQRAAGFSTGGAEKMDMAAVLSGMGAVPQHAVEEHSPPAVKTTTG